MAWLGFPQVTRVLYFVMQFSHKILVALSSKIKTRKKEIPVVSLWVYWRHCREMQNKLGLVVVLKNFKC